MTQLTFGDLATRTPLPKATDEQWCAMCRTMEAIAAATLMDATFLVASEEQCEVSERTDS